MIDFETALRLSEVLLAFALIQRGAEHLWLGDAWVFAGQIVCAAALAIGLWRAETLLVLSILMVVQLHRFGGAYNGGADKMALLCVVCLTGAHWVPHAHWADLAVAYLALQLVLSYWVSGWVKLRNPDWRRGVVLRDVFALSAYPVSQQVRDLAGNPRLVWLGSWAVIGFEVAFPLALLHPQVLMAALAVGALFHVANACLFGLNRFVWIWISAYPALMWFQGRLLEG